MPTSAARRRFTAEYKLRVLREADACTGPGELGALLRREGLYSSHLTTWRRQRGQGALSPKKRGRPAAPVSLLARRVAELEREKARLERRLKQAEMIIRPKKSLRDLGDPPEDRRRRRERLLSAVTDLAPAVGTRAACEALGVSRATAYRQRQPRPTPTPRPRPARALTAAERHAVVAHLHSLRFVDLAPAEVYATLLDEGHYLCSLRTMYRVLTAAHEVRERRNQLRHVAPKPELLAIRPNEVWSWDITKLLGPAKWTYYYLYVILDIFSRYVVGWMVAHQESAALAERKMNIHRMRSAFSQATQGPRPSADAP